MRKCPCCGNKKLEILYRNLKDKDHFIAGEFSILKCPKCKLEITEPLLNEKQLEKYYPKTEYYSYYDYNKLAVIYHRISAYYYSKKNVLFNLIFYPFHKMFYSYYINKGKNVLEIGCGNGMKLKIYKKYGMKTFGLEPYGNPLTIKEKRLGIKRETIKKVEYEKESFDYIVLKEVLEHIPDQKTVLKKCYEWLKPQGKLIITVPNSEGIWKKIFKKNWYGYDIPRHLYNYNPKNLSNFLKKFGFKINTIKIYDLPYMLDGSLKFYLVDKTGKKEHPFVFSNLTKIITAPISLIATYLKIGSIMEVHCSK